ncbi:MAG: ParA family protein [Verrucomicrobiota bacterium]
MAAKAIAFINFKGGVGKTAGAVNVAASLAYYQNKKVLLVDLDPQCNSSFWLTDPHFCRNHTKGGKNSVAQIFTDHIQGSSIFDFDTAVLRGVPYVDEYSMVPRLDLLAADINLLNVEDKIYQNKYAQFYRYLYKTLQPIYDQYDYIIFDCPPNVYAVSKNALFAADYCVVPYMPDFLSLSGFQILAQRIDDFNGRSSGYRQGRKPCSIAALIVNHYKRVGNVYQDAIEELKTILAQLKSDGLVHPKCSLLEPPIRTCAAVAASTGAHQPICVYDEGSNGGTDFYNVSLALEQHIWSLR